MMQPLERDDPRVAGEFRLRARLGSGGMGQVYLGYSRAGRAVAVKICHPEFAADPAFVARFAREVAAARAVNGLYTAQVIGAGPGDSPPWLATSYVPGPSLHEAVDGHGPLAGPAVWRLAAGLAEALRAVHACGLVHRDLKPSNVLLAADGPKVIDFGIACALDGTALTTVGHAFGTPGYIAPEQVGGQPAAPESDVFALGSVLCFAATGKTPFGDGEPPTVLYRVVHAQPALELPPGPLRSLIAGCLAKDPADRPTLAQILRTCQAQVPQLGGPSASFWPGQVAALITRYQAGLGDTAQAPAPAGQPAPAPAGEPAPALAPALKDEPAGEPTRTIGGNRVTPDRPAVPASVAPASAAPASAAPGSAAPAPATPPGTSDVLQPDRAGRPVTRRRTLAGLATAGLAAGLGVGGWAYANSGSGRRPQAPSQLLWARETGGPVTSGAALANGILYVGSGDGKVHAFEAASGRPVVAFPTSGAVSGGVSVAGGTLFAGSADHAVHAFRVGAGGKSWTYRTGGPVNCAPTVAGGIVYVGSDDGHVYAIDAGTGRLAWRYRTGGSVRSAPQVGTQLYSDLVFAGSDDGHLYALGTDGKLQWRFAAGGPVTAGLVYALDLACACDAGGRAFAVWADGPPKAWEYQVGGAVRGTPAFLGQVLYIGSANSAVSAVNVEGGFREWRYPTTGPVNSGPATDGTAVYAGDDDGYLYAIDLTSISLRWRYRASGAVRSQILAANGVVYFGSQDHHVYALRA